MTIPALSDSDPLMATLAGMTRHARLIRQHHPDGWFDDANGRRFHLRPTRDGVTLVCVADELPQMGVAIPAERLEDRAWLASAAQAAAAGPQRPTPEKQVQARIIAQALANGRVLPACLGPAGVRLEFLVDELVVQTGAGATGSRRGDLIALATWPDGRMAPVFIELKSERQSAVLREQVATMVGAFAGQAAADRRAALAGFAAAVLDRSAPTFTCAGSAWAVGVMVWPAASGSRRQTPTGLPGFPEVPLRVIGYQRDAATGTVELESEDQP